MSDRTGAAFSLELSIPHNGSKILLSIPPAVPVNHEVFQPGRWESPAFVPGAAPSHPLIGSFLASPARADQYQPNTDKGSSVGLQDFCKLSGTCPESSSHPEVPAPQLVLLNSASVPGSAQTSPDCAAAWGPFSQLDTGNLRTYHGWWGIKVEGIHC